MKNYAFAKIHWADSKSTRETLEDKLGEHQVNNNSTWERQREYKLEANVICMKQL